MVPVDHGRRPGKPEHLFHDRRLDTDSAAGGGAWPTSKTEAGNYLVWYWGAQCSITSTATVSQTTTGPVPAAAKQCVAPEAIVNPTVATGFDPGPGPVPGNGQNSATLPFKNFQISDVGTNFDYTFRAGLFAGDYSGNSSGPIVTGKGAGGQALPSGPTLVTGGVPARRPRRSPGRNPICEQSDVFFDRFSNKGGGQKHADETGGKADQSFLVAPCPASIKDKKQGDG